MSRKKQQTVALSTAKETSKSIANKCKGLPLAIRTIAVAEKYHRQWQLALDQLRNTDKNFYSTPPHTETELLAKLSLSYGALPVCLRPYFLFYSAFLEDEEIDT